MNIRDQADNLLKSFIKIIQTEQFMVFDLSELFSSRQGTGSGYLSVHPVNTVMHCVACVEATVTISS